MQSELIQLSFNKIMQTRTYTVIVLGSDGKSFAIYAEPSVGRRLQLFLTGAEQVRPLTHDVMVSLFLGMNVRVKQVVINDVQETIYYSRLFLEQECQDYRQIIEIDSRPSDAITLALMMNAPVYCTHQVLEKITPFVE